jgi:hypothetical protein
MAQRFRRVHPIGAEKQDVRIEENVLTMWGSRKTGTAFAFIKREGHPVCLCQRPQLTKRRP